MATYYIILSIHIIGATIWAGGHLVLALSILRDALKKKDASIILDYEKRFEKIGLPALGTQILSGFWLAWRILGPLENWFANNSIAHAIQIKLGLLVLTAGLAINARFRVIPKLTDTDMNTLAWHVRIVTFSAVLFVLAGITIRFGGYPVFKN